MDININTPALLFPAVSLVMLAYTNRFLALSSVVRNLKDRYKTMDDKQNIHGQIKNLRYRLKLIKNMQALGIVTFLLSILSMYLIYIEQMMLARWVFAAGLLMFSLSLILSLVEILKSTKALELELGDIAGLEDPSVLQYIKKKFEKD